MRRRRPSRRARTAAATLVLLCFLAACGAGTSPTAATAGAPRKDSATEAAWRQKAEQFTHDLDTGLQALAATAQTDAYRAVANLGPLTYCSQNLSAVGLPPPVYELAYGSMSAACDQLQRAAQMWRAAAGSSGGNFDTAALVVSAGDRLLVRGEKRLSRYATKQPPLTGQDATSVQQWAGRVELHGESGSLRSYEFGPPHGLVVALQKIGRNPAASFQDIGNGYQDEFTSLMNCSDALGLTALPPPQYVAAEKLWRELESACHSLQKAIRLDPTQSATYGQVYDISASYTSGRKQLLRAVAELDRVAP